MIYVMARYWLRQPDDVLFSRVAREWELADLSPAMTPDRDSANL
jgi:hypothetical protein